MAIVPEREGQGVEELRGDYLEMAQRTPILTAVAAAGLVRTVPLYLDGRAAYVAGAAAGGKGDTGAVLRRLQLIFAAAVALSGTNYWTCNLSRYNNAGVLQGAAGALGTFTTSTAAITARVAVDIGTAALAGFYLQPGDYLELAFTGTGAGALLPDGLAVLEYARLGV